MMNRRRLFQALVGIIGPSAASAVDVESHREATGETTVIIRALDARSFIENSDKIVEAIGRSSRGR